jgi:hypothetical protein
LVKFSLFMIRWIPLVLFFSLVSCSAGLWDLGAGEAKRRLADSNYTFLQKLDDKAVVSADLSSLGPGAWYYAGFVLAEQHRPQAAEQLWALSRKKDAPEWRRLSAFEEAKSAAKRGDWPETEKAARWLVQTDPKDLAAQRLLVTALYWQKDDAEAWNILKNWLPGTFPVAQERENLLFRGVLAARLGKVDEASIALKTLVYDTSPGMIHYRVYSFLEENPNRYSLLNPDGHAAALWQSMAGQGMTKEADRWLESHKLPEAFWDHPVFVEGLGTLFRSFHWAEQGLRWLERIRRGLTGEARFQAELARGLFYRVLERWGPAREAFLEARSLALTPAEHDRASWNWLNAWINRDPLEALGAFRQVYGETTNPSYYSDVLSSWTALLVDHRAWDLLAAVYRDLGPFLTPGDRATVGFLLSRLARHGFLDLHQEGISQTSDELLKTAIHDEPFSYEALVARTILGEPLDYHIRPDIDATDEGVIPEREASGTQPPLRLWVEGFLRFGLYRQAGNLLLSRLQTDPLAASPDFIRTVARVLQDHQEFKTSLVLMDVAVSRPNYPADKEDWTLLFPQAWPRLIEEQAKINHLDPSLLDALVRVESSFDPQAQSWVGAVGLSQLMPQTAAWVARGLRMKTYDLTQPADNLALGARYLADMLRSEDKVFLALMAYNAGGGRVRPWKTLLGGLPQEIFVEGVPITETRYYVKKVLRSAVLYGLLYHGKTLEQMVRLIYPDFRP